MDHIPSSESLDEDLGRKDNLYMNYLKMKKKYKKEYDFTPNKYLLPQDRDIVQKNFKEYKI